MKRFATSLAAMALLVATAPAALAREDAYYTVACDDGNTYESVDARAVDIGHKDDAVMHFSENTPFGLTCRLEGPVYR
jgi:hypothetical protein